MKTQSFDLIVPSINLALKNRPNRRLKTLYLKFRKRREVSLMGDYPLIFEIVFQAALINHFYTPREITKACKATDDPVLIKVRSCSEIVHCLSNIDELRALVDEESYKHNHSY